VRYTLKIECRNYRVNRAIDLIDGAIGAANGGCWRPWCARITDYHWKYRYAREFIRPTIDKSMANSVESRGVFFYWHLPDGVYQFSDARLEKGYFEVRNGRRTELSEDEVEEWVNGF
jgi:hypothetical protein